MIDSASDAGSPPAPPCSALPETIHFSKSSKRKITAAIFTDSVHQYGTYFVIALFLLVYWLSRMFFHWQKLVDIVVMTAVIVGGVALAHWFERRSAFKGLKGAIRKSALPAEPDDAVRVRCVGIPQLFSGETELEDVPFEPQLFFAPAALRFTPAMKWMTGIAVVMGAALAVLCQALLAGDIFGGLGYIVISGGAFLGLIVPIILWPTYIRIVPGRLDVLRFFAFKAKPVQRASYDLKSSQILVDLPRRVVFIDPRGRLPAAEFSFKLISRPRRFAYYLLLAAISTHQPGPLPEDELLG